jgi:hypothetical protein
MIAIADTRFIETVPVITARAVVADLESSAGTTSYAASRPLSQLLAKATAASRYSSS